MELKDTKKGAGRPRGYRCSDETKERISKGMKNYYENMTSEQKRTRERCNRIKSEIFKAYFDELNNLI